MAVPRTKLFVGHLPDGCTNDDLLFLFGKYGTVTECDVINKYGFVHFSSPQEADDAIKALNNYNFRGSSLSVEQSKSKLHHEPGAPGRARGGAQPSFRGRGGRFEGRPSRGGYSNGYQRFDGPPPFGGGNRNGGGDYYDRYGGEGMGPRVRPYAPYERPSMGMSRDEYSYRPSPYSVPSREPYSRSPAPLMPPRDLYERRPTSYPSRSDYLYSRRSPPSQVPSSSRSPYWFNDPYEPASRTPPTATRRPYF